MEKYLYLILNLGSLSVPLWYSFNKKMRFIRYWKIVLLSTTIVASIFLVWDAFFTAEGIWGFNDHFHLPFLIFQMPIEEWLFFFCIPYASIFIYYSLEYFKPKLLISKTVTKGISFSIIILSGLIIGFNYDKLYTLINYSFLILTLLLGLQYGLNFLRRFFIAFLIILIPFFIVNGILTGTGIENPVVWYNNNENLGIRLGTIPVEDIGYAFSMLFLNILLIEYFKHKNFFKQKDLK